MARDRQHLILGSKRNFSKISKIHVCHPPYQRLPKTSSQVRFPARTHDIDNATRGFRPETKERSVVLHGYLGGRHDLSKKLSFVTLHDSTHSSQIQVVSSASHENREKLAVHEALKSVPIHTPVALRGVLKAKPGKDRKTKGPVSEASASEDFEVVLEDLQSLNDFPGDIIITPETEFPPEQRHLQLRTSEHLLKALALRSTIKHLCESELRKNGFIEVETPLLFKSTSEGAREFIVPTRRKGLAYALPQSPQQFKQILMASGIRDYYQFARCFRDEDLRADRQPEFTQLDLERSFATGEDIIAVIEALIRRLWKDVMNVELPHHFPRMTYDEAMSLYGSDKPDLRIAIPPFKKIQALIPVDLVNRITPLNDPIIEAMVVRTTGSSNQVRNFIKEFLDLLENRHFLDNPVGGPGIFVYDSSKPLNGLSAFGFQAAEYLEQDLELEDGALIVLQARKQGPLSGGSTSIGDLRTAIFKAAVSSNLMDAPSWEDFRPLWIIDFPLFSPPNATEPGQGGNAGLASTHHPFTSPKTTADVDLLITEPEKAIGDHYDLVINGEELGGGSRRIHHAHMQEFVLRDVLKMDEEQIAEFAHLLEALRSGCPPHAGIALGFDRLIAMIHSSQSGRKISLRDVIAFPKSGKGDDLMVQSPGKLSQEALETYHLAIRD
ncbi:aspartate--tRNA ligase msd1 [Lecanora helva]